ncbi:hypothetical protein ABZX93_15215 [Streptomyces sp. NPDC006632]|uniref:hypothetical protein n=1 Tax=Streptomyces sp. NPDC006632 TaxID=3157182 RepID=UPI0033AA4477
MSRQVELEGPARQPVAAASVEDDDARYGFTAESPVTDWQGHVEEPLTLQDFEEVWAEARQHLAALEARRLIGRRFPPRPGERETSREAALPAVPAPPTPPTPPTPPWHTRHRGDAR